MMMMMIILLPLLEWVAAAEKTFCFFAGRLSSLLRLPLAARLFFPFFCKPTYYLELSIWRGDGVWSRAELWMLMKVPLKLTVWSFMILA